MMIWPRRMEGIPEEECLCDDEMITGEGIARVERGTLIFEEVVFCVG